MKNVFLEKIHMHQLSFIISGPTNVSLQQLEVHTIHDALTDSYIIKKT